MPDNGSTKKPRSENTKRQIRETFFSLMRKKPWDRISVKELCTEMQITRGTFYNYYDDIYDLMESVQDPLLEELEERMDRITYKPFRAVTPENFFMEFDYHAPECFHVWFHFCRKYKTELLPLMDVSFGSQHFILRTRKILEKAFNAMLDNEKKPRDEMRGFVVNIFVNMHLEMARIWVDDNTGFSRYSERDMINILNNFRIGGAFYDARRAVEDAAGTSPE